MELTNDILSLAAIVTAYVGVSKSLSAGTRSEPFINRIAPLTSLIIAAVFVLIPDAVKTQLTTISLVGLTASGAYVWAKNRVGETK